jgi:outer membrane receptor for ferric coprogen and ferric-rhodotorulic acid
VPRSSNLARASAFAALIFTSIVAAPAQTTPVPAANSTVAEEEAVALSPFTVTTQRDRGYVATNSLSGTRVNSALKHTPSVIAVMTEEFMRDVGANDILEAAAWSLNADPVAPGTGNNNFVSFRGLGNGFNARNNFRYYAPPDNFSVERYDFSMGPNAVLFGDAAIGGTINTGSKRARFKNATALQTQFDSNGGQRYTGDVNYALNQRLAFRLAGVKQRGKSHVDNADNNTQRIYGAMTLRLSPKTEVRGTAEYGGIQRGVINYTFSDQASAWDRTTVFTGPNTGTLPAGVRRLNANVTQDWLVFDSGAPQSGIQNWRNLGTTSGTGLTLLPEGRSYVANFPAYPGYGFTLQPTNGMLDHRYNVAEIALTQQVSDSLFLEAGLNNAFNSRTFNNDTWNTFAIDINKLRPDGQANPNFGRTFSDVRPGEGQNKNYMLQLRASAVYRLHTRWTDQIITAAFDLRDEQFLSYNAQLSRTNGTIIDPTNAANAVYERRYWGDPLAPRKTAPGESNGIATAYFRTARTNKQDNLLKTFSGAIKGSYFSDRLHTLIGLRRDVFHRENRQNVGRNPDGSLIFGNSPPLDTKTNKVTLGAVYFPLKPLGVYANKSQSFQAPLSGSVGIDGKLPAPTAGEGLDFGLKIDLWEGRLSGTFGYYKTTDHNRTLGASNIAGNINAIWTAIGKTERMVQDGYSDTQEYEGTGWELNLTGNPTRHWRLMFNAALPDTKQQSSYAVSRPYLAANRAGWLTDATALGSAVLTNVNTRLATIDSVFEGGADGRRLNSTLDYTMNFFSSYTFPSGWLQGVNFGGGANLRGRRLVGNLAGQPFNYLYSRSLTTASLVAGYNTKLWARTVRFQINVANLFNDRDPVFSNYQAYSGTTVQQGFSIPDERRVQFTTSLNF